MHIRSCRSWAQGLDQLARRRIASEWVVFAPWAKHSSFCRSTETMTGLPKLQGLWFYQRPAAALGRGSDVIIRTVARIQCQCASPSTHGRLFRYFEIHNEVPPPPPIVPLVCRVAATTARALMNQQSPTPPCQAHGTFNQLRFAIYCQIICDVSELPLTLRASFRGVKRCFRGHVFVEVASAGTYWLLLLLQPQCCSACFIACVA